MRPPSSRPRKVPEKYSASFSKKLKEGKKQPMEKQGNSDNKHECKMFAYVPLERGLQLCDVVNICRDPKVKEDSEYSTSLKGLHPIKRNGPVGFAIPAPPYSENRGGHGKIYRMVLQNIKSKQPHIDDDWHRWEDGVDPIMQRWIIRRYNHPATTRLMYTGHIYQDYIRCEFTGDMPLRSRDALRKLMQKAGFRKPVTVKEEEETNEKKSKKKKRKKDKKGKGRRH